MGGFAGAPPEGEGCAGRDWSCDENAQYARALGVDHRHARIIAGPGDRRRPGVSVFQSRVSYALLGHHPDKQG